MRVERYGTSHYSAKCGHHSVCKVATRCPAPPPQGKSTMAMEGSLLTWDLPVGNPQQLLHRVLTPFGLLAL
jgi:hypothetical protein